METPEEIITRLTQENADLKAFNEDQALKIKDAENALATSNEKFEGLQKEFTDQVAEFTNELNFLSIELANAKKDVSTGVQTFSIGKTRYRINAKKFNIHERGDVTLEELLKDTKLQKHLVEIGSGIVSEVVTESK